MDIVKALPPNIDAIDRVFGVRATLERMAVYFVYGDKIYNPNGGKIEPAIIAHERVHHIQQKMERGSLISLEYGAEEWWGKYLDDPVFRLAQEVPAHAAEFRWHAEKADSKRRLRGFRSAEEWHLQQVALRLCSPLYGKLVSLAEAKKLIRDSAAA